MTSISSTLLCTFILDDVQQWLEQHYHQTAPDGRCWWSCVSNALGVDAMQLQQEMKTALDDVNSAMLRALHMTYLMLNPVEVERVKSPTRKTQ